MKPTVLVVDNEESILRSLEILLRKDYQVLTASNGNQALELVQTQKIECIVSDYDMENGNGLDLLKNLKNKEIPFILMTGHGEKDLFKTFANQSVFYIQEKPIDTTLRTVIAEALEVYSRTQKQLKESLIGKTTGQILHDLNNQIHIIQSAADLGLETISEESSDFFNLTLKASKNIQTMVANYKTILNGSGPLHLSKIDLRDFLRELLEEYRLSFGKKIDFRIYDSSEGELKILADTILLRQVLLNLVSNSIEATKKIPNPFIQFQISTLDNLLLIDVVDSGSISAEIATRIFDEGFSTKGESGTGMGLCYCKQLLEMMGARISLTNLYPTTLTMTFPRMK